MCNKHGDRFSALFLCGGGGGGSGGWGGIFSTFFYRVVEAILPGLPVKCFNARYTHVFEASRELF